MNRSVLLVICDFLLLSLLALAKFDEPPVEEPEAIVAPEQQQEAVEEDLIDVLRLSLEAEQAESNELERQLALKEKEIEERSDLLLNKDEKLEAAIQSLTLLEDEQAQLLQEQQMLTQARMQLEQDKALALADKERILQDKERILQEKQRMEARNDELNARTQIALERLNEVEQQRLAMVEEVGELKAQSASSTARLKFLQEELQEKEATVTEFASQQERLEHEKRVAEMEKQTLATQLEVASTETKVVKEQLVTARADVEATRASAKQLQEHATQLAAGVQTLAASTQQIREEVRQLQPLSINRIFKQFRDNRVQFEFSANHKGLLGSRDKQYAIPTVLVSDGAYAYAIVHIEDTPLQRGNLNTVTGVLRLGESAFRVAQVGFLNADPRMVVAALPLDEAERAGVTPFAIALEPLRFPNAVIIDSQEDYFGEGGFKLLPDSDRYLRLPSTLFSRLFGEFSPKRSDLIFAKTGEFMGMMVTRKNGVLITSLDYSTTIALGEDFATTQGNTVLAQQLDLIDALKY